MSIDFTPAFKNELLSRIDIVELIDHRVKLKKAGADSFKACCPFHQEKSPSFTVSRKKQFYHCFGCQSHGNAIDFLIEFDRMEFLDAIETLASMANIEIPTKGHDTPTRRVSHHLLTDIADFYATELKKMPSAQQYLLDRGLNQAIIDDYNIGYSPNAWEAVLQRFGKNQTIREELVSTGMAISKEQRCYDRFRDRIMFPIRNLRGHTIAFGGRILGEGTPKYLNSPETPLFSKGQEIYGLYETLQANRHLDQIMIVEGYMDVIALAQFDIRYAVATLGTAITAKHLQRLFRHTQEIICCLDGDAAGQKAAWRTLEITLPLMHDGCNIRFMVLPSGDDPDSLVRRIGKEAFEAELNAAQSLPEYMLEHLNRLHDKQSIEGKARFAKQARDMIEPMPSGIYKQLLLDRLAETLSISVGQLQDLTERRPLAEAQTMVHLESSPVMRALALAIQRPDLLQHVQLPSTLPELNLSGLATLQRIINISHETPKITSGILMDLLPKDPRLIALATQDLLLDDEAWVAELEASIARITLLGHEHRINTLMQKAGQGPLSTEEKLELKSLIETSKT